MLEQHRLYVSVPCPGRKNHIAHDYPIQIDSAASPDPLQITSSDNVALPPFSVTALDLPP
jgi:hypothetical protein